MFLKECANVLKGGVDKSVGRIASQRRFGGFIEVRLIWSRYQAKQVGSIIRDCVSVLTALFASEENIVDELESSACCVTLNVSTAALAYLSGDFSGAEKRPELSRICPIVGHFE